MTEIQEQAASDILTLIRDQKVTVSGCLPSMQEIADIIARHFKRERQAAKAMRNCLDELGNCRVVGCETPIQKLYRWHYAYLVRAYDAAVRVEEGDDE